jgi:hypothetical protein
MPDWLRQLIKFLEGLLLLFIIFYGAVWITRIQQGPIFWFLILANIVMAPFVCLFANDLDRCQMAWLVFSGIQGPFIGIGAILFWTVVIGGLAEAIDGPGGFGRVFAWYLPLWVALAWFYLWSVLGYGIVSLSGHDWCWQYHDTTYYQTHQHIMQ